MTGDEFKKRRKALGFTQAEFGAVLGLSRAAIINYEAGRRREDDTPVVIPRYVELACDAVALTAAAGRGEPGLMPKAVRDDAEAIIGLLHGANPLPGPRWPQHPRWPLKQ